MMVPSPIIEAINNAREKKLPIVLATGVFDLLHDEHLKFLKAAKAKGWLLVGIESDARVRAMKGPDRPITTQELRLRNLEQLDIADAVFILPEHFSTPEQRLQLVEEIRPHILAVSSHSDHLDRKRAIMEQVGGEVVVVLDHNPAISTSQLLASRKH